MTGMKIPRSVFLVSLVLIVGAASFGYSLHTATRVRELERRLQNAEAALKSQDQPVTDAATVARIRNLEERVRRTESAAAPAQFVGGGGPVGTFGLEQRVQKVEQQIKPHLEVLPPYVPDK